MLKIATASAQQRLVAHQTLTRSSLPSMNEIKDRKIKKVGVDTLNDPIPSSWRDHLVVAVIVSLLTVAAISTGLFPDVKEVDGHRLDKNQMMCSKVSV